ncbi:extracellular solute-binding protein [Halalkalicoccus jeotgali]|uniref:ABC-type iron(III) transport system,substrate-binding protein n=1 Tax=Halalkalicoccus jeotgali (strain DSM 18796 / CECT 7217 / JCM 14584 / KCTC 4019 / B3) TaxID=795797 RepID=D8J3K4_HALJB|nr:extracellular solute-binding protein [Halalkalicoccus jeotgali]ADJ15311.1 ABC-type iron(III) transport system,substrate-binding protein [Halalkalicoccus jeotgali B3]ELY35476.1 iron(III) ABC transporter substrate-binding protein [Halalkalicoccus jeotgali B3]
MDDGDRIDGGRRAVLGGVAAVGAAGAAGCTGLFGGGGDGGEDGGSPDSDIGQIGSGREGRGAPGGTPMEEMPALEGELTLYSGRNEFLIGDLVNYIDDLYGDFSMEVRYGNSADLVNQILSEGSGTPADVFYSVNAGSLGVLADEGRTQSLPEDLVGVVPEEFATEDWIGISGRARTVPYNTEALSAEEMPSDIYAYEEFGADLGWAPSYGSCQAFVTAMRLLQGEERARQWVESVVENGIASYPDEFAVCQAIADGEIDAGFTNHYYIQRVLDGSPGAPIDTAFTEGDAGAIFNVAGGAVLDAAADADLAANFVRHLLSAEAQDYFARTTFEYPLHPEVQPIGDLPTIDELNPPSELDLTQLSNLEPTIDLMRQAGADV